MKQSESDSGYVLALKH